MARDRAIYSFVTAVREYGTVPDRLAAVAAGVFVVFGFDLASEETVVAVVKAMAEVPESA